jgi:hypothetical protein
MISSSISAVAVAPSCCARPLSPLATDHMLATPAPPSGQIQAPVCLPMSCCGPGPTGHAALTACSFWGRLSVTMAYGIGTAWLFCLIQVPMNYRICLSFFWKGKAPASGSWYECIWPLFHYISVQFKRVYGASWITQNQYMKTPIYTWIDHLKLLPSSLL